MEPCEHTAIEGASLVVMTATVAVCPFCERKRLEGELALAVDDARIWKANCEDALAKRDTALVALAALQGLREEDEPELVEHADLYSLEDIRAALEAMRPTSLTAILSKRIAEVGFEMAELEVKRAIDALERRPR